MLDIVYFSYYSGNTHRFVEKLETPATRIPIKEAPPKVSEPYILLVPTYGGGSEVRTVPKQVVEFLNIETNRDNLVGIIGFGNTNFGSHYCKAANIISAKTGKPVLAKVEIFGTPEDVENVKNILTNETQKHEQLTLRG
jgi:protein involved in ribonucleotide reduction